jgi:hypothetical protein
MEEELSIAEIVTRSFVCLVALVPIITASLIVLRRKGRTAEINVIWYAFSLIFVIWWTWTKSPRSRPWNERRAI